MHRQGHGYTSKSKRTYREEQTSRRIAYTLKRTEIGWQIGQW